MKPVIVISCCLIILLSACGVKTKKSDDNCISVVPKPNIVLLHKDGFTLDENITINLKDVNFSIGYVVTVIHDYLLSRLNINSEVSGMGKIAYENDSELASESYVLKIDKTGILIKASDYNGFLYGTQTLMQLFDTAERSSGKVKLPGVEIYDQPAFKWRGMHLDVCRHFFKPEFIKKMLDGMAMHKLNTFHWHLTDDQGWRIEIKKYPQLSTVSAWRDETIVGHALDSPKKYDGIRYGGYYTQEEIKDVIAHAENLGITIVPEIEMPGHAVAALSAFPELSCTGDPKPFNEWGVSDDVFCAGKDETFVFLKNILYEVIKLFPGNVIHIGGDECPKTKWEKCPDCQKRMKEEGLKTEMELQSYFVKRIEKFINSKGKKIIGWDEILEGGLAENAAVMSWRGEEGGIEAAESGHDVVMSPNDICYLDHYQVDDPDEPLAFGGLTTIEDIYKWSIIPKNLSKDKRHHILGAQANVWTEYILDEKHVEYMVFPRLCALSEITWTNNENLNYDDFMSRLKIHSERLGRAGFNYRKLDDKK